MTLCKVLADSVSKEPVCIGDDTNDCRWWLGKEGENMPTGCRCARGRYRYEREEEPDES